MHEDETGEGAVTVNDRRFGAFLGLAIGDALGAAVEFHAPGSFAPVTGYRAGGPHGLASGEWTDDTSMALALADSIATVGWDINDQARRYVDWWRNGAYSVNGRCFDIGITVSSGLRRFEATGDGATSGEVSERSAGNGSIMRLAPVPITYLDLHPDRVDELVRYSVESSLPTHRASQALSACAYFGVVLAGLMAGEDRETVLAPDWPGLVAVEGAHPLHPTVREVALGSFRRREPPEIVGSGYVVRSLEAALWAFSRAGSFEEAVLAAVNLGNDADTTGAICGQLAGACWGTSGMPDEWLAGLAKRDLIQNAVDRLVADYQ